MPPDIELGAPEEPLDFTLQGTGTNVGLNSIKIVPASDTQRATECKIFWTNGPDHHPVLNLASSIMSGSLYPPALRASRLECGESGVPLGLEEMTVCMKFRQTAPMVYTGSPSMEQDGKLISIGDALTIGILGSGPTGKQRRCIFVQVEPPGKTPVRYVAEAGSSIPLNRWTSLLVSWKPEVGGDVPKLLLNRTPVPLHIVGAAVPQPFSVTGRIWIGGNDDLATAPLDLEGFAIYDAVCSWNDAFAALTHPTPQAVIATEAQQQRRTFSRLDEFNSPNAWNVKGDGLTLTSPRPDVLALNFSSAAFGKTVRLMLKADGVPLAKNDLLQYWICLPAQPGRDIFHSIKAIFSDSSGAEVKVDAGEGDTIHICPPNSRGAALWEVITLTSPRRDLSLFRGLEFESQGAQSANDLLYLRGFGLDRTDYRKAKLYYVVGNFRDNFSMVSFNGDGARALTDVTGDCSYPYLLLDNAIDQAKQGRPNSVDVEMECFDANDRLVWSGKDKSIPDADSLDAMHKLMVPITVPGTYWVKSKSYNAQTGEYFTTDWTQICIIRGQPMKLPVPDAKLIGRLHINPNKPFGRFEKTDPLRIDFHVDAVPVASDGKPATATIKYAIVPYSVWVPVWNSTRDTPLSQTLPVLKPGVISIPYVSHSSVELVVAELWVNGLKVDREERTIGIRNDLPSASGQSPAIRNVGDLSALNGGILVSSQFCNLMENSGDKALDVFTAHLDEAKKISPLVEIIPSLERLEPIPGVYDWDYLQGFFDAAKAHGCAVIPYLAQKWPASWAPIDFMLNEGGRAHALPVVWRHMVGGYNYVTGKTAPTLLREFNQQLARRFANEPGFAAYYYENEWINEAGPNSYDAGNRANFQHYLEERYHDITSLNRVYGTKYASFSGVEIPTYNIVDFPKKVMHADFADYDAYACERFTLDSQFDAVRAEEKRRPIFVYTVNGEMSTPFLSRLQQNQGLITNGGVHSVEDSDLYRDPFCSVSGLLERMEPHDIYHFYPIPYGLDEMVFGMLSMGGRGMNYHTMFNVGPDDNFSFANYCKDPTVGYGQLLNHLHAIREIRLTEKLHDPVGILSLRRASDYVGGSYNYPIRSILAAIYVHGHYEPKCCHARLNPHYLDDTKIIFVTGELIDRRDASYLAQYVSQGGRVILDDTAASMSFEHPDDWDGSNDLLASMNIDSMSDGGRIPGLNVPHDVYPYGKGTIVLLRSKDVGGRWNELAPVLLAWASVKNTLASSDDPYMQIHTLRGSDADYVAVTHLGYDINAYNGPREWSGKIRYLAAADSNATYEVTQIWGDQDEPIGIMTASELARGFDVGHFDERQMKIYRIKAVN